MLLKQGKRNEERGASKATGRRKEEQSLTGTQTLSVTSFPTLCFRFFPFFIFPFPVLISRSPFLVLVTSLDSDRSFGPPVLGRSAGSFSEQRLVIEPIFFSAVSKIQYHFLPFAIICWPPSWSSHTCSLSCSASKKDALHREQL